MNAHLEELLIRGLEIVIFLVFVLLGILLITG